MPESACLIFLLALIYAVARLARSGLAVPNALRTILEMGAASLVGFGCCAVLLFSFIEYLGQAQTSHDGQSMVGLQSDPFSLRTLASYIVPLLQGPPYNDIFTGFSGAVGLRGYFGPVASVLALAAVIDWTGRRANVRGFPRILYALVSIVLLLKRFGVPGPQSLERSRSSIK
jgi:hypothetical protein